MNKEWKFKVVEKLEIKIIDKKDIFKKKRNKLLK